jgi:hypothetical protein
MFLINFPVEKFMHATAYLEIAYWKGLRNGLLVKAIF